MRDSIFLTRFFAAALVCLALVSVRAAPGDAQTAMWSVLGGDFSEQNLAIVSIDSTQVTGRAPDLREVTIPWRDFVRADRLQPARGPAGRFNLLTHDGDVLSGEPSGLQDEALTWRTTLLGDVSLPLSEIRAIVAGPVEIGIDSEKATEDAVHLANGDVIRGILTAMNGQSLTVSSGEPVEIPWDSVARLELASTPAGRAPAQASVELWLIDGSRLRARSASLEGGAWKIALIDGKVRQTDSASVLAMERLDGPIRWLSAVAPTVSTQTPYLSVAYPARMDRSVLGQPIRFGKRIYARGIGVHSHSLLTWAIDGSYQTLRLQYAIDGDMPYADVTIRVLLDGKVAHEALHVKSGNLSDVIRVELGDAKTVSLEADWGDGYDVQDRLNWIEPALMRRAPTTRQE